MIAIHDDLLAVLDAVAIIGPSRFSVRGAEWEVIEGGPSRDESLGMAIYDRLYTRPNDEDQPSDLARLSRREFIAALSAANAGRGTREAGWTLDRVADEGRVFVARDGIAFWDFAEGIRAEGGPGTACAVRVPRERRAAVPGFYVADGDAGSVFVGAGDLMISRYYWHLRPEAAVPFLATVTNLLNASGIPFRLKVLAEPGLYRRADAGIVYLDRRNDERARPAIKEIHARVVVGLRPGVPLFTKPIAPGLGFAEDPANAMSFGQHRCRLIAGALWEASGRGETERDALALAIAEAFRREGLDPARPHLGRGAGPESDPSPLPVRPIPAADPVATTTVMPIEAAAIIGRSLCRSAYWDEAGGLCNWVGRSVAEASPSGGPVTPTVAALDPGFYGGSAGIALFLARLWAATGDDDARRTAIGAIRRSIRRLEARATAGPLAFHSGPLGVAFAARQVADVFEDNGLAAVADAIVGRMPDEVDATARPDVLDGLAGAVAALLAIGGDRCRTLSVRLGEDLCRRAIRRDGWCAWAEGDGSARPLTGMSHGAAGIGLALLELAAATGRDDFLETARGAFAYEDTVFDSDRGNWPDLRTDPSRPASGPRFGVAWCHGAGGIAMARLRAVQLDPARGDDHRRWARIAIATTLATIDRLIDQPRVDATLCHGLGGLIEVVATGARMLDEPSHEARARAAAEVLIARHSAPDDWPSGAPSGGPNPSLMIGSAGFGYLMLRLHDPGSVPSLLWIGA